MKHNAEKPVAVKSARNPVWSNEGRTSVDLEVEFSHLPGLVHFTASPDDVEGHGGELFELAMAGEFGPIEVITPSLPTEAEQQARLNALLKQAATTMAPLEDAEKIGIITDSEAAKLLAWRRYRVALYRLPESDGRCWSHLRNQLNIVC